MNPAYTHIDSCPPCLGTSASVIHEEFHSFDKNDPHLSPYLQESSKLKRCNQCQFAFVDKIPSDPKFFSYLYRQSNLNLDREFYHSGRKLVFEEAQSRILKFKKNGKLLDVGANVGVFINLMSKHFNTTGIELSDYFVEYGKSKGLNMIQGILDENTVPNNEFDVVTFIDVLEHVPQPGNVLKKVHSILKPDGILYIKVPNYQAQLKKQNFLEALKLTNEGMMENFAHVNHFSIPSLTHFLKNNGFEILESGFCAPEIWDMKAKLTLKQRVHHILYNLLYVYVTALANTASKLTGLPLGFNLYVTAKKR